MTKRFWEHKSLDELTQQEWESLCDGCGQCCLQKLQDENTNEVLYTHLSCHLLDNNTARCTDYENRERRVPSCIKLTRALIDQFQWLPYSCAYRRIAENRALEDWHPLISRDSDTVHQAGISVVGKVVHNNKVVEADWEEHVIQWVT